MPTAELAFHVPMFLKDHRCFPFEMPHEVGNTIFLTVSTVVDARGRTSYALQRSLPLSICTNPEYTVVYPRAIGCR